MVTLRSSSSSHSLPYLRGHSHTRSLPQNGDLNSIEAARSESGSARSLRSGSQSHHPQRLASIKSKSGGRPSTSTETAAEDDEFESLIAGKDTLKMSLTPSRFKFGGNGALNTEVRASFG